jgi:hypothetical protein
VRLVDFISSNHEGILREWESFEASVVTEPPSRGTATTSPVGRAAFYDPGTTRARL